jgi:hypothetical protein
MRSSRRDGAPAGGLPEGGPGSSGLAPKEGALIPRCHLLPAWFHALTLQRRAYITSLCSLSLTYSSRCSSSHCFSSPCPLKLSNSMASLLTIPLELFVYISSFVSTPDLASLRLACKQTEKSLYEWFSNEFFVKKQFMLTQPSLQVLVDISKHASLSKRMKHVIIATNAYQHSHLHFRDTEALGR